MKTPRFFIMALLCLIFCTQAVQAQSLKTKITLQVNNATLPQVLQKIQHKYAIRFSYLNNDLPVKNRISANIEAKPLTDVLDMLLANTHVGYLEKKGQVIIKKGLPKNLPKTATFTKLPPTTASPVKPSTKTTPAPETKPDAPQKMPAKTAEPKSTSTNNTAEEPAPTLSNESDSTSTSPNTTTSAPVQAIINVPPVFDEDSLEIRPFHAGFIYPLSTNGTRANEYVNRLSVHALVGTAAGSQGLELAGFGNIDKKYVQGFQFAGFFNVIGNRAKLTPIVDSVATRYTLRGGQFAGFLNVAAGDSKGAQFAGFLNITKNITGVQGAGFGNVAKNVSGVQMAGFLNKAKRVNGAQLGIINIADTVDGVAIGLLSIVKKGGYRHAEFYVADDFNANFTYKIGVPRFYTMLALGAELDDKKRWGYGAGFGSEWKLYKSLRLNTDIISYYVVEDSYENFPDGLFENYEVNLLNKFRLLGTLQIGRHLALFGGPTFNVMVSQYQEPGETAIGSTLMKNTFYDKTGFDGTNVKLGIGFNAGIRF
ncbi:FecR domain-containing protein [Adhaeribacter pallidiroseus]|uniref:Protein FecR C-terminal domain-containing protein n=1 Tax=Adhaeribacter pallidiroseus TaxID=2072847 RepID=A0A369QJR9_9BACT|nr:FecR domain-containing protein [Adhaeribacter pallidiroseus]RDC63466.1 hypothetical protein AHMF7616_02070 [Adhaeribacter pallidiroseus]